MRLGLGYRPASRKVALLYDQQTAHPFGAAGGLASGAVVGLQREARGVEVKRTVGRYVVALVEATRVRRSAAGGQPPRRPGLFRAAQARALLGHRYVLPDDVQALAGPCWPTASSWCPGAAPAVTRCSSSGIRAVPVPAAMTPREPAPAQLHPHPGQPRELGTVGPGPLARTLQPLVAPCWCCAEGPGHLPGHDGGRAPPAWTSVLNLYPGLLRPLRPAGRSHGSAASSSRGPGPGRLRPVSAPRRRRRGGRLLRLDNPGRGALYALTHLPGPFLDWDGTWVVRRPSLPTLAAGGRAEVTARARFLQRGHRWIGRFSAASVRPLGLAFGPRITSAPSADGRPAHRAAARPPAPAPRPRGSGRRRPGHHHRGRLRAGGADGLPPRRPHPRPARPVMGPPRRAHGAHLPPHGPAAGGGPLPRPGPRADGAAFEAASERASLHPSSGSPWAQAPPLVIAGPTTQVVVVGPSPPRGSRPRRPDRGGPGAAGRRRLAGHIRRARAAGTATYSVFTSPSPHAAPPRTLAGGRAPNRGAGERAGIVAPEALAGAELGLPR
ncbi:MAG: hypothetical protein R3F43_02985 [bacterium]